MSRPIQEFHPHRLTWGKIYPHLPKSALFPAAKPPAEDSLLLSKQGSRTPGQHQGRSSTRSGAETGRDNSSFVPVAGEAWPGQLRSQQQAGPRVCGHGRLLKACLSPAMFSSGLGNCRQVKVSGELPARNTNYCPAGRSRQAGKSLGEAGKGHGVSPRRGQHDQPQLTELRKSTLVPAVFKQPDCWRRQPLRSLYQRSSLGADTKRKNLRPAADWGRIQLRKTPASVLTPLLSAGHCLEQTPAQLAKAGMS